MGITKFACGFRALGDFKSISLDILPGCLFSYSFSKMSKYSGKKCRLLSMMWLTAFFFFVEIIVGYVTNSMALVADSFHMLGDIAALVISFLSVKVSILL